MQYKSIGLWLGCLAVVAPLAFLLIGCEVDSASRKIIIHPDSATIKYSQSLTLSALNGYVYTWSLSDNTMGTFNTRQGQQVTYTSMTDPATPVVTDHYSEFRVFRYRLIRYRFQRPGGAYGRGLHYAH